MATLEQLDEGIEDDVHYPLEVDYCGLCTMPSEYCEYGPDPSKCYEWMKANLPSHYARLVGVGDQMEELSLEEGKRQTRGGKAAKAARKTKKKLQFEVVKYIKISHAQRGKKKMVTVIVGMKTFVAINGSEDGKIHCLRQGKIAAEAMPQISELISKLEGIDLKKASKSFAQHFSCGSSVTGEDEIVIQGDISQDVIDFIQKKWPEVDDDSIELSDDQKR